MSDIIIPGPPNPKAMADHHAQLTAKIVTAVEEHRNHLPLALTIGILQTVICDLHLNTFMAVQAQQTAMAQRALDQANALRRSDG